MPATYTLAIMSVLTGSVVKPKVFWMWVGVIADFRELLRTIEAQFDPLMESHVEEATQPARRHLEYLQRSLRETEAALESENEYTRDRAEAAIERDRASVLEQESAVETASETARNASRLRVELVERDGTRRTYVEPADVLAEALSRRRFKTMTISGPNGMLRGYSIIVLIDPRDEVRINVSSKDEQWGEAAFARIVSQMQNNVPWWRWVRKSRVNAPLIYLSSLATWIVGWSGVFGELSKDNQGNVVVGGVFLPLIFTVGVTLLIWRVVPAWEIREDGARAKGVAAFALIAGIIAQVVLGIVVNVLTSPR
jgi:hypothetical protein